MADQKPKVTLGYAQSKREYYVSEIAGNRPTVRFIGARVYQGVRQARHACIGDWLSEAEAGDLGEVADLTVRPYRLDA